MSANHDRSQHAALVEIKNIIQADAKLVHRELALVLLDKYFSDIDEDDFSARSARDWATILQNHLVFAADFQTGAPKLRLFTPKLTEHGWAANATVIEFVNDDMPFLVDSIAMEINRQGIAIQQVAHPLFATTRDKDGSLTAVASPTQEQNQKQKLESWIHIEIERLTDPARIKQLGDGLVSVLNDVRAAVQDWPKMHAKVAEILANLDGAAKVVPIAELDEARAFLSWVADSHFTFLGYRDYALNQTNNTDTLNIIANSGLGVLREPKLGGVSASFNDLPAALKKLARQPQLLVLTKANTRATVHRPGYLDYIGIKRFDANGVVIGERRFIGLYTSSSYHADPADIPLLREKTANVMTRAGFPPASHAGKNLLSILDGLPRDELFQMTEDQLFETALGVLHLGERARTKLFIRRDLYARFYSCLIYLPRENYNTDIRVKLQDLLKDKLNGASAEFNVQLTESVLARIHMLVRTNPASVTDIDSKALEADIVALTRRWEDGVFAEVSAGLGEDAANQARREFVQPFPVAYREDVDAKQAIDDFAASRALTTDKPLSVSLYEDGAKLRLRAYHLRAAVTLSRALPMLENMGVRVESERAYKIERHASPAIYIHEYSLTHTFSIADFADVKRKFEHTFTHAWNKDIDNDGFNRLTLAANLAFDEVLVLRAYAKYLKQTGFTFSQSYIEQTLASHSVIAASLVKFFHTRFDPTLDANRAAAMAICVANINTQLDNVANADEDRILRRFLAVISASLRTNFYQRKTYLSIKFDSAKVPELPEPRPLFEIFVYSPRMEGIHLRGGKVARGGLRWSDRQEDFRTEVLGLVKAQMVKNAVIVPVGSKGGFVLKAAPPQSDREAYLKEGVASYKNFLRGLLDVTDNLVKGKVVPPINVVRHDADDPYLVVAADKGTATFSDYANAISAEYGHWLGDAFASGGSVGYDHKKMGITAKGAWESVKRHFRELSDTGHNTQTTAFTVAGVGDMSGDVFGNGMLLSQHIRLVAAFDHRHIFLDPNPDAAASFDERARLFALPRSSWEDYEKSLISPGGGVFARGAKSIALTDEVKQALGIDAAIAVMTPVELMRAILCAPVDLFYNGGIGTYIKASTQTHLDVGDKANDAIRINGNDIRAKVVAEGGNLGATQLGRVEAAQHGVRLYTDAIDNSAGVDCSDHEVNIKILLGAAIDKGLLAAADRDALLATMTDEVGRLVLKDNYYQTQSLSVSGVRAEKLLDAQARFMRHLEKAGRLNRAVEFLPTDDDIAQRREDKHGLTAPERAVLLAYSKMALYDELLLTNLIDDPYVAQALSTYFPTALQTRFKEVMPAHPLKREIIATEIANATINRTGSVFIHRLVEETGASATEIVRCYILTRDVFGVNTLWDAIDKLDNIAPAKIQNEMLISIGRLVLRATLWFVRRRGEQMPIADVIKFFAAGVASIEASMPDLLSADDRQSQQQSEARLIDHHVPDTLARSIARCDAMYAALDIVEISKMKSRSTALTAAIYFALAGKLSLRWVGAQVSALPTDTHWQSMARAAMRDDLANLQRQLTESVLALSPDASNVADAYAAIAAWEAHHDKAVARMREVMKDLTAARERDLAMLSVLLRELRVLV